MKQSQQRALQRPSHPIRIIVKDYGWPKKQYSFELDSTSTIEDVKNKFRDKTGIPSNVIDLTTTSHKILRDNFTLGEYNLKKDDVLYVITKLH
jgi:hypothetical protein